MFIVLWIYHCRLIDVHLSRQKELDVDPKEIQQIELVGKLKNVDGINADGTHYIFHPSNFRKNQRKEVKLFSRMCNSIIKDGKSSRSES